MKIMINALSARRGGGQTYIQNLLEHFPVNGVDEVVILAPQALKLSSKYFNVRRINAPKAIVENPLFRGLLELFFLPRLLKKIVQMYFSALVDQSVEIFLKTAG